jgi:hypothetical protein
LPDLNPQVGGGTPLNFGPCGDVLDQDRTLAEVSMCRQSSELFSATSRRSWRVARNAGILAMR